MKDGCFLGKSQGYGGDLELSVTVSQGKIEKIDVVKHSETKVISDPAFALVLPEMIAKNSVCVPNVNGCSVTSMALKRAVGEALISAGVDRNTVEANILESQVLEKMGESQKINLKPSYDVVVVGSGGAGLTAAISARKQGASVVLLEKMNTLGGNTLVSMGGVNVPGNDAQIATGVEDTVEAYYHDIMVGGDHESVEAQARFLADRALPTYQWLKEEIGVSFKEKSLIHFGGHSVARAAVFEGKYAIELITKLREKALALGVVIATGVKVNDLLTVGERVSGVSVEVKGEVKTILANSGVLLATGGFSGNIEMRMKYDPSLDSRYKTTNVGGVRGEGHVMAEKVGAKFVHMDYIQTFPIANPETGELSHVGGSRFDGAILVNKEGKRFVEELERRDVVSEGILNQTGGTGFLVWGQEVEAVNEGIKNNAPEIARLQKDDLFFSGQTLAEVGEAMKVDVEALEKTVSSYNGYVAEGKDPDFNRRGNLVAIEKAPYYIQEVAPAVHHTMGGLVINALTQVLNQENQVIEGLYAAGEIVGGTHGTNRLGGNAITEILVYGKHAGENIVKK